MLGNFSYNFDVAHSLLNEAKALMNGQSELPKAKQLLENSIQIFPNYVEAHYCLAGIYEKFDDYNNACDEYQKAIIINPFYSKAYYKLGIIYDDFFQDFDAARMLYEHAIQIKSNYFDAIYRLALLLENKYYDYDKAVHYYDAAHKLKADNQNITFRMAGIYREHLLDFPLARKYYQRTVDFEPKHWEAHYYLAIVLAKKLSNKETGKLHYIKAVELNKSCADDELDEYFGLSRNEGNKLFKSSLFKYLGFLILFFRFR